MDRRARFGAASKRFSVNQPWSRFDETYVTRPADTPGDDVASALRLDPFGTHVLLGAIGTGKSTELFRAASILRAEAPDVHVVVADADLLGAGLEHAWAGLLLTRVAEALAREAIDRRLALPLIARQAAERILKREKQSASGSLPVNDFDPVSSDLRTDLQCLRDNFPHADAHASDVAPVVVLLDSFDRLRPPDQYIEAVVKDLAALARLRIGLVVTGSLDMLYQHWREQLQHFDRYHVVRPFDAGRDEHRGFLDRVLRRRDADALFDDRVRERLVRASGGHMRSLVQLAKMALERAERGTGATVSIADADTIIDRFADNLVAGLVPSQRALLGRVARGEVAREEEDELVTLLRNSWVFDEVLGGVSYRVHPVIASRLVPRVA